MFNLTYLLCLCWVIIPIIIRVSFLIGCLKSIYLDIFHAVGVESIQKGNFLFIKLIMFSFKGSIT